VTGCTRSSIKPNSSNVGLQQTIFRGRIRPRKKKKQRAMRQGKRKQNLAGGEKIASQGKAALARGAKDDVEGRVQKRSKNKSEKEWCKKAKKTCSEGGRTGGSKARMSEREENATVRFLWRAGPNRKTSEVESSKQQDKDQEKKARLSS